MTDADFADIAAYISTHRFQNYAHDFWRVRVEASDYNYEGWLVAAFPKRKSGAIRCVVEDEHGRLFIHNPGQLTRLSRP